MKKYKEQTMAIITKRRKAYSVIYQRVDKNGIKKPVWETYYDYSSAIARQKELEETFNYDKMHIDKSSRIIDFLEQYVTKIGPQKWSVTYCEKFQGVINNYLKKIFSEKRIADIQDDFGAQTMKLLEGISGIGRRHQKAAKNIPFSMQRSILTLLRSAFDYLVAEQLIVYNPFLDVNLKMTAKISHDTEWNLAYVESLFRNIQDIRLFLLVHLLFSTGLDINEITGLTWDNIHIDKDLIESEQCFIKSDKLLKRMNKNTIATFSESQIIQQFRCEGYNQTNTNLTLMYKDSSSVKIAYLHQPVAMLLKEWKKQQEHYYSSLNPCNLVIMLGSEKPCDTRSLSKMYHAACKNGKLKNLTLAKLKSFSKKQMNEKGCTNADYYYSHLDNPVKIPDLQRNPVHVLRMVTQKEFNSKVKFEIFEKRNEELQLLLHKFQESPELKMKLIDKIRAER